MRVGLPALASRPRASSGSRGSSKSAPVQRVFGKAQSIVLRTIGEASRGLGFRRLARSVQRPVAVSSYGFGLPIDATAAFGNPGHARHYAARLPFPVRHPFDFPSRHPRDGRPAARAPVTRSHFGPAYPCSLSVDARALGMALSQLPFRYQRASAAMAHLPEGLDLRARSTCDVAAQCGPLGFRVCGFPIRVIGWRSFTGRASNGRSERPRGLPQAGRARVFRDLDCSD